MAAQPVGKDPLLGKRNFKEPESSIQTPKNTIQPLPTPITKFVIFFEFLFFLNNLFFTKLFAKSNQKKKKISKRQKITEKTTKFTKEIQNDIPMKEGKQTRECHNMNERQRRLKINQKIQDLKELLPKSCADILTNKLAILHESVDHIQNLHRVVEHLNERNLYLEQRLIEQEKDLLLLKQFNNNNNNNNSINNNSNNANNNKNNDNNDNNDNSNNNSINPSALSNLLATSSIQYQRQLPSNSVINYNLLSPISALFNR